MEDIKQLKNTKVKRYVNRAAQAGKALAKFGLGLAAVSTPISPIMAGGIALIVSGAVDGQRAITGEYLKNSMINVTKDDLIVQDVASPSIMVSSVLTSDKKGMLIMQELNFLLQADRYKEINGNKERIKYHTHSQAITYKMLKMIQKSGFIENLEKKEIEKSRIIGAKLLMGNLNLKTLMKKESMYDITFNITDKQITDKDILELYKASKVNIKSLDDERLDVRRDKEGNVKSVNFNFMSVLKEKIRSIFSKFKGNKKEEVPMLQEAQSQVKVENKFASELENMVANEKEHLHNSILNKDEQEKQIDNKNIDDDLIV